MKTINKKRQKKFTQRQNLSPYFLMDNAVIFNGLFNGASMLVVRVKT